MKKFLALLLALTVMLTLFGCGGNGGQQNNSQNQTVTDQGYGILNDGKPLTLRVDLQALMPSMNTEVTIDNPIVNRAAQELADEFNRMYPNVTIEWIRDKGAFGDWAQWMITQIAAETPPHITFMQGSTYSDRGWFIELDKHLDAPNPFVEGNEKWRDQFPNYLWNSYMTSDANGNVVAIPVILYPGVATAYFYNKDIFAEVGVEVPSNWEEYIQVCEKITEAGYVAVGPWTQNKKPCINCWDIQFSLGPTFALSQKDQWDYDGDGIMSQNELLRAEYEGLFYASNNPAVMEIYGQVKRKYQNVLQEGAANTDYETLWKEGKVAMMEDGAGRMILENANTERGFEYGIFAAPIADSSTSQYAQDVEFEKGPYQPPVCNSFNIVKAAVDGKPGEEEAAIRFLQWITTPENNSQLVLEFHGQVLGAVKDCEIPPELAEWFKQDFPRTPQAQWVLGPTLESTNLMSRYLEMWVWDYIGDEEFIEKYDKALYQGVQDQIAGLGIDTTGWQKYEIS